MKHIKTYENFDFDEEDFDFEEDNIIDLSGLKTENLAQRLQNLLHKNSDFMEFHYLEYTIMGDGYHFADELHHPRILGNKSFDDVRDTIFDIDNNGDDLIFYGMRSDYVEYGNGKNDDGFYIDREILYKVNRKKEISFVNKKNELKINISE